MLATGLPGGLGDRHALTISAEVGSALLRACSECCCTQRSQDLIWLQGSFRLQGDDGILGWILLVGEIGLFPGDEAF